MGGKLGPGFAGEPVSDVLVGRDERGRCPPCGRTNEIAPALAMPFQGLSAHLLVMDDGVCRERGFAAYIVRKLARVLRALPRLSVQMAWTWIVRIATAHLSRSMAVWRLDWTEATAAWI